MVYTLTKKEENNFVIHETGTTTSGFKYTVQCDHGGDFEINLDIVAGVTINNTNTTAKDAYLLKQENH